MNIEDKTPNDTEPSDPANQAASLANMTLKSPKPGTNGARQKRPRKAADAMGGAAAKDKPAKGKSRKKALSFDDLAQATASANVVSIAEARSGTEAGDLPPGVAPAESADDANVPEAVTATPAAAPEPGPMWEAAPAPAAEIPTAAAPVAEIPVAEIAAEIEPAPAAEASPLPDVDSMDAALEQSQALLAQALDDALASQIETAAAEPAPAAAAPLWNEPAPVVAPAPVPEAPKPEPVAAPAYTNGNGAHTAAEAAPAAPAEESNGSSAGRSRFEAIAARAARAQGSRTQPGSAVQAALAAQQQAAEKARQGNDFYSFWAQRKNGRRFPSYGDFDAKQIAELWPNTMLLSCGAVGGGNVNFTQVMRLTGAAATAEPAEEVTFTPMLTEWMLAIGREAVSAGKPVQDIETFQNTVGSSSYRIVALPLGNEETQVDHVLCNLARA
ncbi:MAG: hypothetical protein ACKVOI_14690 [Dongiaceae bacterium]